MEAAERRRLEGNALFAEGKYKEALAKYALVSRACSWQGLDSRQQVHVRACSSSRGRFNVRPQAGAGTAGKAGYSRVQQLTLCGVELAACCPHVPAAAAAADPQAISYCDEDFMIQLQGPHLDKAEEVTDPILLNMAAAQLKTGEFALAAHNSTQVRRWVSQVAPAASVLGS